jgi:hypothetical protein
MTMWSMIFFYWINFKKFMFVFVQANVNTENWKLISAVLVGALYPNVVQVMTPEKRHAQSAGGNSLM